MKKYIVLIIIATTILFYSTACGSRYEYVEDDLYFVEEVHYEAQHYEAAQHYETSHYEDVFSSGRTRQEYLDDLDFLYNSLVKNFPFFGVIYRGMGIDMHSYYLEKRERLETIDDILCDLSFAMQVNGQFLGRAREWGHLHMFIDGSHTSFLRLHLEAFNYDVHNGDGIFVNFLAELDNPATRALHNLSDEHFAAPTPTEQSVIYATHSNNIETEILEEGRIAYLNIHSMDFATMHIDEVTLLDFFHEVADYEHLIIDIRQNVGGYNRFFPNLIIAPNISESLEWEYYLFLMGGEHNNHMLTPWMGALGEGYFQQVDYAVIAQLPYLSQEDIPLLDYYFHAVNTIYPSLQSPIFGGKIWLLVSEWVFSSSEQAAIMTQQTGFATLVGQTTGGDGLGFQPIVLTLPNTGIVVRYSAAYGVDNLGRNNQEFATTPCIYNMPDKDALQTVLYLIG